MEQASSVSRTTSRTTSRCDATPSAIRDHQLPGPYGVLDAGLEARAAEDQGVGIGRAGRGDLRARRDTAGRPLDAGVLAAVLLDQRLDPARRAGDGGQPDLDVQPLVGRGLAAPLLDVR